MFLKIFLTQTICLVILVNRLVCGLPLASEEEEDHVNNRLKHYIKRIELAARKGNNKFSDDLQNLMDKFKHSLDMESFKEKSLLLEEHNRNMEFVEYLSSELDRQYMNEDILIESWYINEIAPYLDKDLYEEVMHILHGLKEAYRTEDLEKKFDIYADIGENVSEKFLDYFYGEDVPVPLLNAQLKYFHEYFQYLLQECQMSEEFEKNAQDLVVKVEKARASDNKADKEYVIDLFDDLTTKFGRYLDEHFTDFKMFKFGE